MRFTNDFVRISLAGLCIAFAFFATAAEPIAPKQSANASADAAALKAAVQPITDKITPVLPKGWTAKSDGDCVIVERTEPVEFVNRIGLADGQQPQPISLAYRLSLRIGDRMSDEQFRQTAKANDSAVAKAENDMRHTKDSLDEYLQAHPEYGVKPLAWLDTGKNSIYAERTFGGNRRGFLEFKSDGVEAECRRVDDAVARLFREYKEK